MLADMISRNAVPDVGDELHGLRDVNSLRAFLTGRGIFSLFDLPLRRCVRRRQVHVQ